MSATTQLLPRTIEEWADNWTNGGSRFEPHHTFAPVYTSHTHMFNWLGFPAASIPCGFVDGLPIGLQIVALPGNEAKIFRVANAFQERLPAPRASPLVLTGRTLTRSGGARAGESCRRGAKSVLHESLGSWV